MTGRLNVILSLISHYKYLIVCVIGVLIVGLIDENSFLKRFQLEMQKSTSIQSSTRLIPAS